MIVNREFGAQHILYNAVKIIIIGDTKYNLRSQEIVQRHMLFLWVSSGKEQAMSRTPFDIKISNYQMITPSGKHA